MRNRKIVLLASDMEHVWRKWHSAAGHSGVQAMMLRIQQAYYYCGNLHKWIADQKGCCGHCNIQQVYYYCGNLQKWIADQKDAVVIATARSCPSFPNRLQLLFCPLVHFSAFSLITALSDMLMC
jgi:hypothetical protein